MVEVTVTFPEKIKDYIEQQTALEGHSTTSDYLQKLVNEERRRKAEARLEELLMEGINSGDPVPVTPEFWKNLWARVDARLKDVKEKEAAA